MKASKAPSLEARRAANRYMKSARIQRRIGALTSALIKAGITPSDLRRFSSRKRGAK